MRAFISYSHSQCNSEFARRFIADLSTVGFETDSPILQPGQDLEQYIRQALEDVDYLFVLISSETVANAKWVMAEVDRALEEGTIRIVPVIVDQSAKYLIPARLAEHQWLDLSSPEKYETNLRTFAAQALRLARSSEHKPDRTTAEPQFAGTDMDELVKRIAKEVAVHITSPPSKTGHAERPKPGMPDTLNEIKTVFVVMSFSTDMEPVFEGIRDAAISVGLEAKRVKDVIGDYQITTTLIQMLQDSSIVVVDLTHERPNVYFELGYARGIGKTVITTAREGTPLHFDVRDWTCTFYSDSRILERSLKERFKVELANMLNHTSAHQPPGCGRRE